MQGKIIRSLDRIDGKLDQLFRELEAYTEEQRNQRPSPGSWSAHMVMHHVMRAEMLSRRYVEKKLSFQPKLKNAGISEVWRRALLAGFLWAPFKFKAPKGVNEEFLPETSTIEAIRKEWTGERQALRQYLSSLPEEMAQKLIYKHPFAGRLTFGGMLAFFEGHFDRHHRQIRKALAGAARIR